MLIVLTTTPNIAEAEDLARKIIEAKLAACVQVLPRIVSFYVWENEIKRDAEYLLLIKSLDERYSELETFILDNHSYETPEIVAVKAEAVSEKYLDWMNGVILTKS